MVNERIDPGTRLPVLNCLGGRPTPPEIIKDWRRFRALPEAAQLNLWSVLGPSLAPTPIQGELDKLAEAFCTEHRLAPPDLNGAIHICRFLFSQAASLNISTPLLKQDLEALSGGPNGVVDALASGYEQAAPIIRQGIVDGSLLDHGKLVTGLDWRVDRVLASDRGASLDIPVALLTLRHQTRRGNFKTEEGSTYYLTPAALRQLRDTCEKILTFLNSKGNREDVG